MHDGDLHRSRPDKDVLAALFVQTPDSGLILLGLDRCILQWTGACPLIFGYTAEEMVGRPMDLLFTEEDRTRGIPQLEMDEALRSPRSEDDRWHVRADGSRVFLSGSVFMLRDEEGRPTVAVKMFRDHTDRRAYVETLEHRLDERERARAFKDVSLAALAHELRGPLGPLRHAMQMVRLACQEAAVHPPLAIMDRQLAALQRLVDDLVDAGRVATGQLTLQIESMDLNAMVQEVASAARPEFDAKDIDLAVITPPTPIVIEADRTRLQQVLTNLLSNAMRYTLRGGRVWIKTTVEANLAVFRVQDTGVGLDAESLPYLFNLFTRGPHAAQLAPQGMGVGLSLVKQIVERHDGAIDVRSEGVGQGTEVSVHLPFRQRVPPQIEG